MNAAKSTTKSSDAPKPTRTLDLTASFSVPVPADIPKTARATELPFKAKFTENLGAALEGKQPHFFVPDWFWLDRGAEADKVDKAYGRTKVRDAFNAWVKADEATRSGLSILIIYREVSKEYPDAGVSFWMVKK